MDVGITRLNVPGTYNFREVAPGVLKPGVLYRSDALHRLTRVGRSTLREFGIRQVIDLRSRFDRRIGGRDRLRGTGVDYLSVPMGGKPANIDPKTVTLREVYEMMLARHQADFGRVLRAIASADGATLVHCTAGKDRTGLVAALALTASGVEQDVILADYAATAANLSGEWTERMLRKVRRFRVPITDQLIDVLAGSPPTALSETLDWIDSEYGSALVYLDEAGVDAGVRQELKRALLPAG